MGNASEVATLHGDTRLDAQHDDSRRLLGVLAASVLRVPVESAGGSSMDTAGTTLVIVASLALIGCLIVLVRSLPMMVRHQERWPRGMSL